MHAQVPSIMQHLETLAAGPAHIEMNHKLVNHFLQQRQIPAATATLFEFRVGQPGSSRAVPFGSAHRADLSLRTFATSRLKWSEPPVGSTGAVSARALSPHHGP